MLTTKRFKLYLKLAQSSISWDHSIKVPQVNSTITKINATLFNNNPLFINKKGNRSTNSTSKIKNTIEIRKKCMEKGDRDLVCGTKPHSKGLSFSESYSVFILRINENMKIITLRTTNIIINSNKILITKYNNPSDKCGRMRCYN